MRAMFDRCTEHRNDMMVVQFVLLFLSCTIFREASMKMDIWPQLFKRWKKLSTAWISIQRIAQLLFLILIQWIVIYPVDSAVRHLNNWGQNYQCYHCKKTNCQWISMVCTLINHRNDVKCSNLCSETTCLLLMVPLELWTFWRHFYGQ